jgi:hypothetical protein
MVCVNGVVQDPTAPLPEFIIYGELITNEVPHYHKVGRAARSFSNINESSFIFILSICANSYGVIFMVLRGVIAEGRHHIHVQSLLHQWFLDPSIVQVNSQRRAPQLFHRIASHHITYTISRCMRILFACI